MGRIKIRDEDLCAEYKLTVNITKFQLRLVHCAMREYIDKHIVQMSNAEVYSIRDLAQALADVYVQRNCASTHNEGGQDK